MRGGLEMFGARGWLGGFGDGRLWTGMREAERAAPMTHVAEAARLRMRMQGLGFRFTTAEL